VLMGKDDADESGARGPMAASFTTMTNGTSNGEHSAKPTSEVSDLETAILDAASVAP